MKFGKGSDIRKNADPVQVRVQSASLNLGSFIDIVILAVMQGGPVRGPGRGCEGAEVGGPGTFSFFANSLYLKSLCAYPTVMNSPVLHQYLFFSVADPGSGAFLTPGSGIRNRFFRIPEFLG
jgi:hypothetical protein